MADRTDASPVYDTDWLRVQSRPIRVIAASNVAIMGIGCLFLLQFWRMDSKVVFWSLLAALAAVGLNLVFLHRTQEIKIAGYISVSVLFVFLVIATAWTGGFYDPFFSWLYVVPLAAAFLVDLTALVVFLGAVLATTVIFWFLPPGSLPEVVPAAMYPLHSLLTRLATLLSLGVMTAFFVRAQYRALKLLKGANEALREEVEAHSRTSDALAESEYQLRDLVEHSADMIWTHDLEGTILSANESFGRMLGLPASELVGSGASQFVASDALEVWNQYLTRIAAEGAYRGLLRVIDADGKVRVLEFHNTLRDDGVEAPVVRALARDVTEQVAFREALQRRVDQEQLMVAISTRFIETGSEELATAIEVALGEIGVFLGCDRASFFLLRSGGEGFARLASWSSIVQGGPHPTERATALPWLRLRLEQFETIAVSRLDELPPEGQVELLELLGADICAATVVPVFGREGLIGLLTLESIRWEREWLREHQALAHIAAMVFGNALMRDRDEKRSLRLLDEIQQARKMESLGLIAGGIAHDFNNLLMVVLGNASLAMAQVAEGSGAQEALQAIDSSARSAAKLTSQMLAYSGGAALDRGEADLNDMIAVELEQVRAGLAAGIELRTKLDPELPPVYADAAQIRQMLRALLDNACEATGEAGGTVEIETRRSTFDPAAPARGYRPIRSGLAAGPCAVAEVRDSGAGIEPASIEKIFDPFYSTKFAGRGLGLAAVLGVVRGHEGLIEVDSAPGSTRLRVWIPIAKSDPRARSPTDPAGPQAVAQADVSEPAILVLDSNPEVLAVLDSLLASAGFESVGTRQIPEAIQQLEGNGRRFRAVVAELETVEASDSLLAARWRTENIPWIFSSAERREDIAERLAYSGASGFLSKPFDGRKLLSLLEGLLREYPPAGPAHQAGGSGPEEAINGNARRKSM